MIDLSRFTKGARLLQELTHLQHGQTYRISRETLADITVPANPMDKQTPSYLIEWFRIRLPFSCRVNENLLTGDWTITR